MLHAPETMRGFIDLHSHWIADIDDGARSAEEGVAMLRALHAAGFSTVVATPHMRPGLFDNDRAGIQRAFEAMQAPLAEARSSGAALPDVCLGCEHFFDDVVFQRLLRGEGIPYPGGRAALVEFSSRAFPLRAAHRMIDLHRASVTPVLAHPERYAPVWHDDACLDPLIDAGAHLLLDVCALVGKYGRQAQRVAEKLLEDDAYEAACSDAHSPADGDLVYQAIVRLEQLAGQEEATRLLRDGPKELLMLPR